MLTAMINGRDETLAARLSHGDDGIFDADTALPAVEELVFVDLAGRCLVLDGRRRIGDDHVREGMRAALVTQ